MKNINALMQSLCLESKITEQHASDIEAILTQYHQDLMSELSKEIGAMKGVYSAKDAIEKAQTIIKSK